MGAATDILGGASAIGSQSANGASIAVGPGQWTLTSAPGAAAQPTATKAAGAAGVRHVCTGITATVAPGATAQGPILCVLRDGATGAGTILWQGYLQAAINGKDTLSSGQFNIVGSAATAMCIELNAATAATVLGSVSATGYDAS